MPTLPDELTLSLGAALRAHGPALAASGGTGVAALGRLWQQRLDATVTRWQAEVGPVQVASLLAQVEHAIHGADLAALTDLSVTDYGPADDVLLDAMRTMAADGAASVVADADAAGLRLGTPPPLAAVTLADWARSAADLLAAGLSLGVAREALRLYRPGASPGTVAAGVRTYFDGLTDRSVRDVIGGALTRAQNLGRLAVYGGPIPPRWSVQLIADETLDSATCSPCRSIDGTTLPSTEAAALAYGGAGYLFCQGRERCRGTVRGEWTREVVDAPDGFASLAALLPAIDDRHYKRDHKGRFSETDESRLKAAVAAAKALADDDPAWHRLTGGQSGSGVRMAVLPDGRRVVRKQAPDWGSDEPTIQADAEHLASRTGDVLNVSVALVQRDHSAPVAWVQHHDGPTLAAAAGHGQQGDVDLFLAWRGSNAGIRMGLLDVLIGNNDRNSGNYIIDQQGAEVIGIDHAYAFEMLGLERGAPHPQDLGRMGGELAPARHFIATDRDGHNTWERDNPMTPGDVIETRARLETLRTDYRKAGRERWLDNALLMLDQLAGHATGTESIYDD